ncbi:methyltransferase domain-containing protein [Candidatus Dependentiae bacterium]|nr:methyltransferase domain-containing protein [Candidatus Dependentiae bacterium]
MFGLKNENNQIFTYAEPFILVNFILNNIKFFKTCIDLGTGSGSILFLLNKLFSNARYFGLELVDDFLDSAINYKDDLAIRNIDFIKGDILESSNLFKESSFDLVTFNPPYYGMKEGRLPQDKKRLLQRFEVKATLNDFLKASNYLVKPSGRVFFIYPSEKINKVRKLVELNSFYITSIQRFYHNRISKSTLTVFQLEKSERETNYLEDLIRNSKTYKQLYQLFFRLNQEMK